MSSDHKFVVASDCEYFFDDVIGCRKCFHPARKHICCVPYDCELFVSSNWLSRLCRGIKEGSG